MLIDALVRAEPERRRKVSFLLELLDNRDYAVKYEAVRLLGQMGPVATEAFSKLTNLFSLTTDEKNMHANRSFMTGIYIDKASFDTDLTSYWGLHRCTVVALGQLGPAAREVIPFLAQEARDTANPFRFDAAVARWRIDGKNDELLPVLAAGLAAPDSSTRGLALGRVTEISSTCGESVGLLVKALGDPEMKIRLGAIQTLADLGTNALTAVPALEGLASDPKFLVRAQARKLVETLQATTPSKIAP
jgi:HEAT repeat protein